MAYFDKYILFANKTPQKDKITISAQIGKWGQEDEAAEENTDELFRTNIFGRDYCEDFIFDTGAERTVILPKIAQYLKIQPTNKIVSVTAGPEKVEGHEAELALFLGRGWVRVSCVIADIDVSLLGLRSLIGNFDFHFSEEFLAIGKVVPE